MSFINKDYKDKYMKYKLKYLNLKDSSLTSKNMIGGSLHIMNLSEPWFSLVRDGRKSIEGRIYDDKRRIIQIGDTITFTNNGNSFSKAVVDLAIWDNTNKKSGKVGWKDVITWENYTKLIPTAEKVKDAVKVYEDIPGYKEKAKELGIIFIYLQ